MVAGSRRILTRRFAGLSLLFGFLSSLFIVYLPDIDVAMMSFETIHQSVFVASCIVWGGYPLYGFWKIFEVYRDAKQYLGGVGFVLFAIYLQAPYIGDGKGVLRKLPYELQGRAAIVRSRQKNVLAGMLLWLICLVLVGVVISA